jgi:hypothetical protein
MAHIKKEETQQTAAPPPAKKPALTVAVEYDDSDEDEDYDMLDDDLGDGEDGTYDFLSMDTAAGVKQIEKNKSMPQVPAAAAAAAAAPNPNPKKKEPAGPPPVALRTPKMQHQQAMKKQEEEEGAATVKIPVPKPGPATPAPTTPVRGQPSTPVAARTPQQPPPPISTPGGSMGSPDPHNVKDTDKIKRKKASLPTNMPVSEASAMIQPAACCASEASAKKVLFCGGRGRERRDREDSALLRRERARAKRSRRNCFSATGAGAIEAIEKKMLFCGGSGQAIGLSPKSPRP